MSLYTLALFLHVSGAIGTFVSLGIWLFGLVALRRATKVEQVRALAWLIIVASPFMVVSVLLLGLAGFAMAFSAWGLLTPWIAVSLVIVVLIGIHPEHAVAWDRLLDDHQTRTVHGHPGDGGRVVPGSPRLLAALVCSAQTGTAHHSP